MDTDKLLNITSKIVNIIITLSFCCLGFFVIRSCNNRISIDRKESIERRAAEKIKPYVMIANVKFYIEVGSDGHSYLASQSITTVIHWEDCPKCKAL